MNILSEFMISILLFERAWNLKKLGNDKKSNYVLACLWSVNTVASIINIMIK